MSEDFDPRPRREVTRDELIAKLEAATEGSRELDAEIAYRVDRNASAVMGFPRYTTSLDAALTLVPEGYEWDVGIIKENGFYSAHVMWRAPAGETWADRFDCDPTTEVVWNEKGDHYASPALALCIAALKARAK